MNILVTGANGYLGTEISKLQINDVYFFKGFRNTVNLLNQNDLKTYILNNKIDVIIHCAIEGGKRGIKDSLDNFYNNLLMAENILSLSSHVNKIINIASGAEFDRKTDILNNDEEDIFNKCPTDYYGLSKNIIAKRFNDEKTNTYNIRIFGCFDENEINARYIKSCIINNISNKEIIIHEDKYMDFIYMDDLIRIIKYYILNKNLIYKDINACYEQKLKLSEIASFINNITNNQVSIKIENPEKGLNYSGDFKKLKSLEINLTGLTNGILNTYNKFYEHKNNISCNALGS